MRFKINWHPYTPGTNTLHVQDGKLHKVCTVPSGKEVAVVREIKRFERVVENNSQNGKINWPGVAAEFQAYIDEMLARPRPPRAGPFRLNLQPDYFRARVAVAYQDNDPDHILVMCESEPNVEVGEDMEIVVADTVYTATVATIFPPKKLVGESIEELRARDAEAREQFKRQFGFYPPPTTKEDEERLNSAWGLFLRHKGERPKA